MTQAEKLLAKRVELQANIDLAETTEDRITALNMMTGFLDAILCMDSVTELWPADYKDRVAAKVSAYESQQQQGERDRELMEASKKILQLEGFVMALRELVEDKASHSPGCKDNILRYGPDARCTCGLEQVLEETEI